MIFSLILCSIHRTKEVDNFLNSLLEQTYAKFEVFIIDQNDDDRLNLLVKKYKNDFYIKHIKSKKGLSIARNIGLEYITGDIVAFPDDDCIYPPELLANINTFFTTNNYDILMGKTIDKDSGIVVAGKSIHKSKELSCYQFLGSSTTIFLNLLNINKRDIYFDVDLGLGAKFHSGEEEDLIIRLLSKRYKGFYAPDINYVYHPPSDLNFADLNRIKNRSMGLGAMTGKHIFSICGIFYFMKYVVMHPIVSILRSILSLDILMIKYHFYRYIGIVYGLFTYIILNLKNRNKA